MEKTATDRIEEQVRSVFPDDTIARVQVLEYGDDPEVEPGETAIRVFISRAGQPEGKEADEEIVKAFEKANHAVIKKAREQLPRLSDGSSSALTDRTGRPVHGPILRIGGRGGRARALMKCPRN